MNNFQTLTIILLMVLVTNSFVILSQTTPRSEAIPSYSDNSRFIFDETPKLHHDPFLPSRYDTKEEVYTKWVNFCDIGMHGGLGIYCVEEVLDDRLATINQKLDYIIYSNGYNCDHIFGNFNGTKCFETWKNKQ